ncbi:RusA family crossover junction endodeoxyribonuclease [Carnimonas bestiolae]|uniref:RusA family crossover junction endodeoxyribonuclease n=1 Tax=Carnimonas bestiolae TaxID=3402172 RepID=UPI003EDB8DD7
MISLTLSFPPTVNSVWRSVNGRTIMSKRGREYRKETCAAIAHQLDNTGVVATGERLRMEVLLYPPDRRKRDIDNYNKALLDAITNTGRIWHDDSQIDLLTVERRPASKGGYCIVNISEIGEKAA